MVGLEFGVLGYSLSYTLKYVKLTEPAVVLPLEPSGSQYDVIHPGNKATTYFDFAMLTGM